MVFGEIEEVLCLVSASNGKLSYLINSNIFDDKAD